MYSDYGEGGFKKMPMEMLTTYNYIQKERKLGVKKLFNNLFIPKHSISKSFARICCC